MRTLWRIVIVIPAAFIAASIAAAIVLALAAGVHPVPDKTSDAFVTKLLLLGLVGAMFVGAVAGFPALIVIILAEAFGWRSLILHLLIGAGIGFAAFLTGIGSPEGSNADLAVGGGAGAVGGFVYWLIAGRDAGPERDPRDAS